MIDWSQAASLLADLVRIESINPELVPGGSGEGEIAQYVCNFLGEMGLEACKLEVAAGRFNTVGMLRGRQGGPTLMLNGHLDTVGVDGMAEPFGARIERGRLYGRGAQDMKGGMAAALLAARELVREDRMAGNLLIAAVADEEMESLGTRALLNDVHADAAIVLEPTALEIAIAHKGFAWAEVTTDGCAAHGSRPEEGKDAIAFMGRVLTEMEGLERRLQGSARHPLLGCASVHASLISGGQELSSYPRACRLSLERRLLPGESAATFDAELSAIISKLTSQDAQFKADLRMGYSAEAFETDRKASIAQTLARAAGRWVGDRARFGAVSFWTDAALLAEAGIPTVVFGPGGAGLHSASEYVELEDVCLCAEVLADCARTMLGGCK